MNTQIIANNKNGKNRNEHDSGINMKAAGNHWIEFLEDEELKKIDAYIEWEQEYYIINQSYLLEEKS